VVVSVWNASVNAVGIYGDVDGTFCGVFVHNDCAFDIVEAPVDENCSSLTEISAAENGKGVNGINFVCIRRRSKRRQQHHAHKG
jgi:hypothetical protein